MTDWRNVSVVHSTRPAGSATAYHEVMTVPAQQRWASARDLVGDQSPSADDGPLTLTGEPLDTPDKVRDFLARVADSRTT